MHLPLLTGILVAGIATWAIMLYGVLSLANGLPQ